MKYGRLWVEVNVGMVIVMTQNYWIWGRPFGLTFTWQKTWSFPTG